MITTNLSQVIAHLNHLSYRYLGALFTPNVIGEEAKHFKYLFTGGGKLVGSHLAKNPDPVAATFSFVQGLLLTIVPKEV